MGTVEKNVTSLLGFSRVSERNKHKVPIAVKGNRVFFIQFV
jgi:hypothetical protein